MIKDEDDLLGSLNGLSDDPDSDDLNTHDPDSDSDISVNRMNDDD
jgi:hypothetical protein